MTKNEVPDPVFMWGLVISTWGRLFKNEFGEIKTSSPKQFQTFHQRKNQNHHLKLYRTFQHVLFWSTNQSFGVKSSETLGAIERSGAGVQESEIWAMNNLDEGYLSIAKTSISNHG
jgi:hypothetical protein